MGWTIGLPSLKLNLTGDKSKHCGGFYQVGAEALQERRGHDPDINPELAEKNIYLGYQTADELMAYSAEHCSTLKDSMGRGIRSDGVRMCVTIIKPPAAFMATLSEEEQKQFLDDGVEKFKDIVGADNVKSLAYHFDEQGAHVHIFWEPMTKDGRLCAKEVHNLKFFNRLNKEMPQHLRERGWDIDDCNAYDQAKEKLLTEKEKAERRRQNGRSSYVYKAEAQQKLNEIHEQIDATMANVEERLEEHLQQTIEHVANNNGKVFDNVLFLMSECSDERFEQLDQEGRELKKATLQEFAGNSHENGLDKFIENLEVKKVDNVSWERRQKMWEAYNEISRDFWDVRAELKNDYQVALSEAYKKQKDAMRTYYDALYFLNRSRGFIGLFAAVVWVCVSQAQKNAAEAKLRELRNERSKLIENTATFKRYSNAYREELKKGKMPFEKYLDSMAELVHTLDEESTKFKERGPVHKKENMLASKNAERNQL